MGKIRYHRVYKGVNVTHIPTTPAGMRWQAYVAGTFVYADTLAGIKQLVTILRRVN